MTDSKQKALLVEFGWADGPDEVDSKQIFSALMQAFSASKPFCEAVAKMQADTRVRCVS